jgi:tRNA G10  N-methylase Trm11
MYVCMMFMSGLPPATHVFILGKNWKLSFAELLAFMKTHGSDFSVVDASDSFVALEASELAGPEIISELGGTLKIGRVISAVPLGKVEAVFLRERKTAKEEVKSLFSSNRVVDKIFTKPSDKYTFGVSIYCENRPFLRSSRMLQRFIGSYFKKELMLRGAKAQFMGVPRGREPPQLTNVEVLKKGLVERSAEVLFCIGRGNAFLSATVALHNPFEFQKRDIYRPVQRKIFSIPPRVARIMINLASCLPRKTLLDPFCGVGTILQEAMLAKAQVIGIDKNRWCVEASAKNLEWLQREYGLETVKYQVMVGDARSLTDKVVEGSIDCIVTEPALGPPLRDIPTESHAKRIISDLEPLYEGFLNETYKTLKPEGKAVFVTPYIRTRKGSFQSLDVKEKARRIGFKVIPPFREVRANDSWKRELAGVCSLVDIEERHKVGREIHVIQR